jgi:hypothetical protein
MSMEHGAGPLLQREIEKAEIIAGLRHALDSSYRRLIEAARADWERLFGSDPADACVTVRVAVNQPSAVRGSGFLKSRRQSAPKLGKQLPGFAH